MPVDATRFGDELAGVPPPPRRDGNARGHHDVGRRRTPRRGGRRRRVVVRLRWRLGVIAFRRFLVRLCVVTRLVLREPRAVCGRLRRHEGAPRRLAPRVSRTTGRTGPGRPSPCRTPRCCSCASRGRSRCRPCCRCRFECTEREQPAKPAHRTKPKEPSERLQCIPALSAERAQLSPGSRRFGGGIDGAPGHGGDARRRDGQPICACRRGSRPRRPSSSGVDMPGS